MAKHKKYFIVVEDGHTLYLKLECEYSFSVAEGIKWMKESRPNATSITPIAKSKAEQFLGLF